MFIALVLASVATAFSLETFTRVVEQLGSAGQIQVDKIFSAATDLLEPQANRDRRVPAMLQPFAVGPRIVISNGAIHLPPTARATDDNTMRTQLDLLPQEEEILRLLRNVRNELAPTTTVRIAGGWVRDKLIYGRETPSRDIDLVLSDMSGKEFAAKVCQYVERLGEGAGEDDVGAIMQVQQPSSGKGARADHLQTASLRIGVGEYYEVDFGCLRYERYDPDSRIPANCRVASAVEDAWRRDLTINALYYNLNTNEVEDYTERGLRDLISQTIDTPKRQLPTLLEDPMRILRAVRFAAQLSFDVSPALMRAARDERVRAGLLTKVSRDAIGAAVDEMLGTRTRDPARGIRLLIATNLIDVVFPLSEGGQQTDAENGKAMLVYKIGCEYLSRTCSLLARTYKQSPGMEWDISKRRLLWYAAFLKPVYEMGHADTSNGNNSSKRRRRQKSTFYQVLQALKRPKTDIKDIERILKGIAPIQATILTEQNNNAIQAALFFGDRFRDLPPRSPRWEGLSELRWIVYTALKPSGALWKEALLLGLASSQLSTADGVARHDDLISLVDGHLHLDAMLRNENQPKPLLNGAEIQQVFRGGIDGRAFKDIVEAMEEWQIRHDGGTPSERRTQLAEYLLTAFADYANDANATCEYSEE